MEGDQNNNLCVMVFRPFIVSNVLEEIFINAFQVNGFIMIKKKYLILKEYEINFLERLEKVESTSFKNYFKLMNKGKSCVVLFSSKLANEKAHYIAEGVNNIINQKFYEFSVKEHDSEKNAEQLMDFMYAYKNEPSDKFIEKMWRTLKCPEFTSLEAIISYKFAFLKRLIKNVLPNFLETNTYYNSKKLSPDENSEHIINKTLFNVEYEKYKDFTQAINNFNPEIFITNNTTEAAELSSILLGDVIKTNSVLLIIKPFAFLRQASVISTLNEMGFEIAFFFCGKFDEKSIDSFIDYATHYFKGYDSEKIKYEWLYNHFIGLKVSKVCAREEIRSILNVFDLISHDPEQGDCLSSKNWRPPGNIKTTSMFNGGNFDMAALLETIHQQIKTFKEEAKLYHHSVYNPLLNTAYDQGNR